MKKNYTAYIGLMIALGVIIDTGSAATTQASTHMVRVWAKVSDHAPVIGGAVEIFDQRGQSLGHAKTGQTGQAVIFLTQPIDQDMTARVLGGSSELISGDDIHLIVKFSSDEVGVVHINPYTTLMAAHRQTIGQDSLIISKKDVQDSIHEYYEIPSDFEQVITSRTGSILFDCEGFVNESKAMGMSLWEYANYVSQLISDGSKRIQVLDTVASFKMPQRQGAIVKPTTAGFFGADLLFSVLTTVGEGAASKAGVTLADKILISMGFLEPPPDYGATLDQIKSEVENISQAIIETQKHISYLSNFERRINADVLKGTYTTLVREFNAQYTALNNLAEYLEFLSQYSNCTTEPTGDDCANEPTIIIPPTGVGRDICHIDLIPTGSAWGDASIIQCVYFMNALSEYTTEYLPQQATNMIANRIASSPGILQVAQNAYAAAELKDVITSQNQLDMLSVGEYWLHLWSWDIIFWLLASEEPSVLPNYLSPDLVFKGAKKLAETIDNASQDTTGNYFPRRIPSHCDMLAYDRSDEKLYGIGQFYRINSSEISGVSAVRHAVKLYSTQNGTEPCDPASNSSRSSNGSDTDLLTHRFPVGWDGVDPSDPTTAMMPQGISAFLGNLTEYAAVGTQTSKIACYRMTLSEQLHSSSGYVGVCPYIKLTSPTTVLGMSCNYANGTAGYINPWEPTNNNRFNPPKFEEVNVSSCENLKTNSGEVWVRTSMIGGPYRIVAVANGPLKRPEHPLYEISTSGAQPPLVGGGEILGHLPTSASNPKDKLKTVQDKIFMKRNLFEGEVYVPRM